MFCRFCGATLPDDSAFCQSCGKSLTTSASASPTTGTAATPAIAPTATPEQQKKGNQRIVVIVGLAAASVLIIVGVVLLTSRSRNSIPENSSQQTARQPAQGDAKPNPAPTPTRLTTEELFKQAAPSVVLIEVFKSSGERFGMGSGFIAADGAVVTNYHVIRGAYSANVRMQDGSTYPIQSVVGLDPYRDVAVTKVSNLTAKPLALGDSEKIQVGDRVVVIGSPLAIQNTLSAGIISGIRNGLIQTSAPISPGSSGGPLFNRQGEVVGITVSQITAAQNLNFAVPINWAKGYLRSSEVTSLSEVARQNTVEQGIVGSTFSVPAHQRRVFNILVDRNRMADAEIDGTFSSTGGLGGEIRVFVATSNNVIYDSGRTTSGTVRVPLGPGIYQLVIDNTQSVMFARDVTADFKFRYVK